MIELGEGVKFMGPHQQHMIFALYSSVCIGAMKMTLIFLLLFLGYFIHK